MNLHGIVRGAINSVNPDRPAVFLSSTGNTVNADGSQTPGYAAPVNVTIQIQPLGKEELRHIEKLNLQGVYRTVYMFGDTEGLVRVQAKGGDLLQFTPFGTQAVQVWKVVGPVSGPWNVDQGGWTKFLVCLQTDSL